MDKEKQEEITIAVVKRLSVATRHASRAMMAFAEAMVIVADGVDQMLNEEENG